MAKLKCPNCNHYKIIRNSDKLAGGAILMVIGLLLTPVLIGIPLLIMGIGMLVVGFGARFSGVDKYFCKNCHKEYPLSEKAQLLS